MNLIGIGMAMASSFALHNGDRVVFYGDSITEQGHYTSFTEAFIRTRYPSLDVRFFNRGWSGDASWGGGGGTIEERVKQDVAPLKPTVITALLGMNDGGYVAYDRKIADTFSIWYGKLLSLFLTAEPEVRITCIETCPWDEFAHELPAGPPKPDAWAPWKGYNEVLVRYGEIVRKQAEGVGGTFVDFNAPLVAVLKAARIQNPGIAKEIVPDSIHPGPPGGLVMAGELVKAWGFDPLVSSVKIDTVEQKVSSENAVVSELSGLEWNQVDSCLPLPVALDTPAEALAWKLSGLGNAINQVMLTVTGLGPGSYRLEIDKKDGGTHTAKEWTTGVNIGEVPTPMRDQALKVLELVKQRNALDFFRWRTLQREHGDLAGSSNAIEAINGLEEEMLAKEREAAKPVSHHFALTKV